MPLLLLADSETHGVMIVKRARDSRNIETGEGTHITVFMYNTIVRLLYCKEIEIQKNMSPGGSYKT